MANYDIGAAGEKIAADYLEKKGYRIVQRNWRCGKKEIDLIAKHGDITVFAEVKARHSFDYGFPEEAVTKGKQVHLRAAASVYLDQNPAPMARFDVISILLNRGTVVEILHYEDAFY